MRVCSRKEEMKREKTSWEERNQMNSYAARRGVNALAWNCMIKKSKEISTNLVILAQVFDIYHLSGHEPSRFRRCYLLVPMVVV